MQEKPVVDTKAIVHVGLHKTGSTNIQRYLEKNKYKINPIKLYKWENGKVINSDKAIKPNRTCDFYTAEQLSFMSSNEADKLIIRLKNVYKKVSIILVTREKLSLTRSHMNQAVKHSSSLGPPGGVLERELYGLEYELLSNNKSWYLDIEKHINKWKDCDELKIISFEDLINGEKSYSENFFKLTNLKEALGIFQKEEKNPNRKVNKSLDYAKFILATHLHRRAKEGSLSHMDLYNMMDSMKRTIATKPLECSKIKEDIHINEASISILDFACDLIAKIAEEERKQKENTSGTMKAKEGKSKEYKEKENSDAIQMITHREFCKQTQKSLAANQEIKTLKEVLLKDSKKIESRDVEFVKNVKKRNRENNGPKAWIYSYKEKEKYLNNVSPNKKMHFQAIQYWSQGNPSSELNQITSKWNDILKTLDQPNIQLFDKNKAYMYIQRYCPDLLIPFETAFHYAVEADIFRIAYALNNSCIWLDSDLYPTKTTHLFLPNTFQKRKTTLMFRWYKPWITNAFFVTDAKSPLFNEISKQMKNYSFKGKEESTNEVLSSFGPRRYNRVWKQLMKENKEKDIINYQTINTTEMWRFGYINEYNDVKMKPPFELSYKSTDDNWKSVETK